MREGLPVPLGLVVLRLKKRWIGHLYLMVPTNAAGAESFGYGLTRNLFGDTPKTMVMAILSDKDEMGIIHEVVNQKIQSLQWLHQHHVQRCQRNW